VADAHAQAVTIGMSPYIMPVKRTGPARLDPAASADDPVQQELAFVVAAAAEAVAQAARALGPEPAGERARRQALASFADLVRDRLEPPPGAAKR
jgi:hypothetical protein